MKKITIVSNFCRNLDFNDRFIYIAQMLHATGRYDVELITSDFTHDTKQHRDLLALKPHDFKLTLCHEPGYTSNKSLQRLLSHRRWGKNVLKHIKAGKKPDIIYCAVPSLTAAHDLAIYAKKNGSRMVVDVQDLWPEATFMLIKNRLIQRLSVPMAHFINVAYRNADAVVAVSQTYVRRALSVNRNGVPSLSIYLGNDAERFFAAKGDAKPSGQPFIIGYIGTLGYSYDIGCVIEAIKLVNDTRKYSDIKFLVMGDGPLKMQFEQLATEANVNCEFTGMLPYEKMVHRLCSCEVVVNPIKKGSAASIINKVGDYALSALPVINTQENEEYRQLIDIYHCGINCIPENSEDVASAIIRLMENQALRTTMSENSLRLGLECFDRRTSYLKITDMLDSL